MKHHQPTKTTTTNQHKDPNLLGVVAVLVKDVELGARDELTAVDAGLDGSQAPEDADLLHVAHERLDVQALQLGVDGVQAAHQVLEEELEGLGQADELPPVHGEGGHVAVPVDDDVAGRVVGHGARGGPGGRRAVGGRPGGLGHQAFAHELVHGVGQVVAAVGRHHGRALVVQLGGREGRGRVSLGLSEGVRLGQGAVTVAHAHQGVVVAVQLTTLASAAPVVVVVVVGGGGGGRAGHAVVGCGSGGGAVWGLQRAGCVQQGVSEGYLGRRWGVHLHCPQTSRRMS